MSVKTFFKSIKHNFHLLINFFILKKKRIEVPDYPVPIYFDHMLGGGTKVYSENFLSNNEKKYLCIVIYKVFSFNIAYSVLYDNHKFVLNHSALKSFLKEISIESIYVNSLVHYTKLFNVIDDISNICNEKKINLTVAFHDYYPVCKCYNLYCNHENCKKYCSKGAVLKWRMQWKKLFDIATELRTFSDRSKQVLMSFIPEYKDKMTVVPHSLDYLKNIEPIKYSFDSLNIGIMGEITTEIKGLHVLKQLSQKFIIHVFGSTILKNKNIIPHGRYSILNIRELLVKNHINLIVFTSICEETFSYVTSEIIALGLPVICFDIGTQCEKVKVYDKGYVVKDVAAMMAKIEEISSLLKENE